MVHRSTEPGILELLTGMKVHLGASSGDHTMANHVNPEGLAKKNRMWLCSETSSIAPKEEELPLKGHLELDCRDGGFDQPPARY